MSKTKVVKKDKEIKAVSAEIEKESQTEKFIFEDLGTKKYAQVHDYEISDSVRVIPRKKNDKWDILALSTRSENLDRLDTALSSGEYTLNSRKINTVQERVPVLIHEYKQDLETEFPEADLLKRIEVMKAGLEASK